MNCDDSLERLSAYQDKELDPDAAAETEAHLASCEACRRRLADYGKILESLRPGPETEPSPGFTEAVLGRAAGRGFAEARRRSFWIPAAAAAAGVLLAASLLFLGDPWSAGPANPAPAPSPVPAPAPAPDPAIAEIESAVREDPELLDILENLDALEQIELLENLPVLEHLDEIQAGAGDELAAAVEDLAPDADVPLEER
ncbi:MAG: zf-HC2 domain-containing protein [Planctomycetes bacterium]|nr:zf-HC2 domain-containing protein [Planctomycetota bacterium]